MKIGFSLAALCLLLAAAAAHASGLAPWEFGMSKAQVSAFAEYGPYKSFSNGDLETYSGVFGDYRGNVQFYFGPEGLNRISVSFYEGTDPEASRLGWLRAYEVLRKEFGEVETPSVRVQAESEVPTPEVLSIAAAANTSATGRTQMAPRSKPAGMSVFSTYAKRFLYGKDVYNVVVYFVPRP